VSVIITSVSNLSFLRNLSLLKTRTTLLQYYIQILDPVASALTVRTTNIAELFKMLPVSVTWVTVPLLETHSSGEASVISTMIVPAVTPTLDVRVRMGSVTVTDSGSVTSLWTVTS